MPSPTQLLIVVLVLVLLFGASKLPNMARSMGRSMRIFKSEMNEMKKDGETVTETPAVESAVESSAVADPEITPSQVRATDKDGLKATPTTND